MEQWTKDKEKKLISRYRFALTFRIIRIGVILVFLYGIYTFMLNMAYYSTDARQKHHFNISLAFDWTEPTSRINYNFNRYGEISSLLTQSYDLPIYRRIGKEFKAVGNLNANVKVFDGLSDKEVQYFEPDTIEQRFRFYSPVDIETGKKLNAGRNDHVWKTLKMVHEGTVADFAFSTDEFMSPEDIIELLEPYDIDILWMPLYTGELDTIQTGKLFSPGMGSGIAHLELGGIGIRGILDPSDDYMSLAYSYVLDDDTIKEAEASMLKNMKHLLDNESDTYIERFLQLDHLEERYQYIQNNGFQAYGAVITGPVKEILKIKEQEKIRAEQLGQLHYWNWNK